MGKSNVLAVTLQGLLADRGWSQGQLARQTGIPQPTISRILSGRQQPNADNLRLLAQTLGVTTDVLLYGAPGRMMDLSQPPLTVVRAANLGRLTDPIERELLRLWPRLSEPTRRQLWEQVGALQEQANTLAALDRLLHTLRDLEATLQGQPRQDRAQQPQANGIADSKTQGC